MGCACVLRKDNVEEVNKEVNDQNNISNVIDIENNNLKLNDNNNNDNKENNNKDNNGNIIFNNQLKENNMNTLGLGPSKMDNKRAKSAQLNQYEETKENNSLKDSNYFEYMQIESDIITPKELQEFLSNYESLNDSVEVEIRPTTICENKTIYYGEWDKKNNKRHGRGIQVWPDGAKYMGYWKNNQANGKGKLIHQDGDIYEGDWQSDKPNGNGCYIHVDGTKYVGEWKNDKQDGKGRKNGPMGVYIGEYKDVKK